MKLRNFLNGLPVVATIGEDERLSASIVPSGFQYHGVRKVSRQAKVRWNTTFENRQFDESMLGLNLLQLRAVDCAATFGLWHTMRMPMSVAVSVAAVTMEVTPGEDGDP
jgi:hypothetical protein